MDWFARGRHRGADRALGLRGRRCRPGAGGRQRGGGREARRGTGRSCFPGATTSKLQRAGAPQYRNAGRRARSQLAAQPQAAGGGHAPGAVPRARRLQGARGARLHLAGLRAGRPAPAEAVHARAVLQDAGRDGGAVRRPAAGAGERGRDRAPLQPGDRTGQKPAAGVPDAEGRDPRCVPGYRRPRKAWRGAWRSCTRSGASEDAPLPRAPGVRDQDHRADGLRGLLPDRRRLHQLGEVERRAGRARAAARAPARWWPTRSASPTSIRSTTTCCSSASSIRSACRCPTSTSTSARTAATA